MNQPADLADILYATNRFVSTLPLSSRLERERWRRMKVMREEEGAVVVGRVSWLKALR